MKLNFLALILKKFLYFLKGKLFWYFGKQKPQTNPYIPEDRVFLYLRKWGTLKIIFIFQEATFPTQKSKKSLPRKKFLCFRRWNFLATQRNFIKFFNTLNKTPLGQTG